MTRKILLQLDTDSAPSVFDSITAVDSDVDVLLRQQNVTTDNVEAMVHGAIFTRGGDNLRSTAIFVGGSNVAAGEAVFEKVKNTFFGPCRVSAMLDSNGSNTTAAAAVLSAARHVELSESRATVLAGTGPVGVRCAELLMREGAHVTLTSRKLDKAETACQSLQSLGSLPGKAEPFELSDSGQVLDAIGESSLVFACGGAGVCLWPDEFWAANSSVKVAVDVNAVPPLGIEKIGVTDKANEVDGVNCYGAIGVGGLKMKIHKRAVLALFEQNDRVLAAPEIFQIGKELMADG